MAGGVLGEPLGDRGEQPPLVGAWQRDDGEQLLPAQQLNPVFVPAPLSLKVFQPRCLRYLV